MMRGHACKPSALLLAALALLSLAACSDKPESVLDYTNEVAAPRAGDPAPPPPIALAGRVTDQASVLSALRKAALETRLAAFEQASGHQLVVVTVQSLDGADVARFTAALANAWGIGRKGWNDGVVLLVAPKERKVRIAVGDGLGKVLDDAACARIIAQRILPLMREGDLAGGIEAGVTAIIATLGGEQER